VSEEATERTAWDRLPTETTRAYAAFREYRDLGPRRTLSGLASVTARNARTWSRRHHWTARATAWDDEVARVEDLDRLDALRTMHGNHSRAARVLQQFALSALQGLDAETVSAADVARLFELGAKLERLTLSQSVEELQGRTPTSALDDPWTRIANELAGSSPDYVPT
jgi:hypothetical protein